MGMKIKDLRFLSQISSFIVLNLGVFGVPILPLLLPVVECTSIDSKIALCNFGVLLRNFSLAWEVSPLFPLASISMFILFGAVFGRALCGWVCPLGLVQDLIMKVTERVSDVRDILAEKTHYMLTSMKYIVLLVSLAPVISISLAFGLNRILGRKYAYALGVCGQAPYCIICPVPVIFSTIPSIAGTLLNGSPLPSMPFTIYIALAFFVVFLGASILGKRSWCRYLCPLGALMSLFNRFSLLHITKEQHKCTAFCRGHQKDCVETCSMGIKVYENQNPSASPECIYCYECSDSCTNEAIRVKIA